MKDLLQSAMAQTQADKKNIQAIDREPQPGAANNIPDVAPIANIKVVGVDLTKRREVRQK